MKYQKIAAVIGSIMVLAMIFGLNVQPAAAAFGDSTTYLGKIYAGDGGDALNGYLDNPYGFALDSSGNFIIADTANNVIRKIDGTTNVITTVAGTGNIGTANTTAATSTFYAPQDVEVGPDGTIYVADTGNGKIRKISGEKTTTLSRLYSATTYKKVGKARVASVSVQTLKKPTSIALNGSTLYIAENGKNRILTVPTSGGTATEWLSIQTPWRVLVNGNYLYVIHSDQGKVSKVDLTTKAVTELISGLKDASGLAVYNGYLYVTAGENGIYNEIYKVDLATSSYSQIVRRLETEWYNYGSDILFKNDKMYILFSRGSSMYKLDVDGQNETRVAGVHRYGDTDGSKAAAVIGRPKSLVFSKDKTKVYLLENHKIKEYNLLTETLRLIAGHANDNYVEDTGGIAGRMSGTTSIVMAPNGQRIYFADRNNNRLRYLDIAEETFHYLTGAGGKNGDGSTDNGYAEGVACKTEFTTGASSCAYFNRPNGIAISKGGSILYVADTQNQVIRKVDTKTGTTSLLTGQPGVSGFKDGKKTVALFNNPFGVSLSSDGSTLYVADRDNNAIRSVRLKDGLVKTIVGNGKIGYREGKLTSARLALPENVLAASKNILYFTELGTNRVREINLNTRLTRLVSGNGSRGSTNGLRAKTTFNGVKGLLLLNPTTLLVADQSNDLIRAISLR